MVLRKQFLLTLLAVVMAGKVQSQQHQYYAFDNLGGITQKLCVRSIAQSSDGMIWLAAESGLYSYDGNHLINRPFDKSNAYGLSTGSFNFLLALQDSLLIGCNKGVLSFNLSTYRYRLLPYAKDEIVKDIVQMDGSIWVAAKSGIYKNGSKLSPCPDNIVSMFGDNHFLYIGTTNAVFRYSVANRQLERFTSNVYYASCFYSSEGSDLLWIGSANSISGWSKKTMKRAFILPIPVAKSLCTDGNGNMLVGTDNGLHIIGKDLRSRTLYHDARRESSLAGDAVWSIFRDQSDRIWMGTNSGVSILHAEELMRTYFLPSITGEGSGNQFFCTFCDSRGRLWLGGSNGLMCIEQLGKENQSYRWYRMNDELYPIPHNRIRVIHEESNGKIVIGGDMGLMLYDEKSKQFHRYRIEEDPYNWVYDIRESQKGELVITTYTATYLGKLDRTSALFQVSKTIQGEPLSQRFDQEKSLLKKYGLAETYLSAYEDANSGMLLLGGTDRFSLLDTKSYLKSQESRSLTITDIKINDKRFIEHKDILQGKIHLKANDEIVEVMFSDFKYSGELAHKYVYRIDEGAWIPVHSLNNSIVLTNLVPGKYTLFIRASESSKISTFVDFKIQAPWYASTIAKIIYLLIFFCMGYGVYYILRQRKRSKLEHAEHQKRIQLAKQKEKELLSDNEYLAAQLRMQLLAKAGESGILSEEEKFLLKITKIIEENMSDFDLNVQSLSEYSGISSKQLYRKIKAMTGMTTVAYIRDQRLKKAASLLAKGSFTVSEVMYMVGFSNPSYFTRCFTEEYKTPPSEYRP